MLHPVVYHTSEICHAYGVKHIVMSPGSRNAPLTVSFARNQKVKKWIVPDERSAGFVALGIAQKLKEPVALCCTSGSALLNYYPAVAEAYYREIPLIVLSADRPPELIDQRDGQTIRQFNALDQHVKTSLQLPLIQSNDSDSEKEYKASLINALQKALQLPKGPVHINIPFKEPFYPTPGQALSFETVSVLPATPTHLSTVSPTSLDLTGKKIMVLVGQHDVDESLSKQLGSLSDQVVVIQSPLNNLSLQGIRHVDFFLNDQPHLAPDVLITAGLSVLSKKLKNFLRKYKPKQHFHLDPAGVQVDTYATSPELIPASLESFLEINDFSNSDTSYASKWKTLSDQVSQTLQKTEGKFAEVWTAQTLLNALPIGVTLHLSNSMPVRWADLFGVKNGVEVFSNRGTSGIDGCTSTAVGSSLVSDCLNVLVTGDVAFFYDRNAFFHNYDLLNFRVVLFNNQGGGIFRLIDGPARLPELESYFETRHQRTAEYICKENDLTYQTATNFDELEQALTSFFDPSEKAKVLEVFTEPDINQKEFKRLKQTINERINQMG